MFKVQDKYAKTNDFVRKVIEPVWSTFGGRKKVAIGACMQESAILAFPSHSMLSKR